MKPSEEESRPLDLGHLAEEPPTTSVREEAEAASPEGQDAPDAGGLVPPDHSQSAPPAD